MAFKISVQGFAEEGTIPTRFTCEGSDVAPALHWAGEPSETKSFALIVDDPDAPGGVWNHWLLWDIPASLHSIAEGGRNSEAATAGTNDFGKLGYGGPCPPRGKGSHRYFFRLFALNAMALGLAEGAQRPALENALRKHAIAETAYMGRYERH